ncbi:MAG: response regulator [Desulfomonilaceae bacterium]
MQGVNQATVLIVDDTPDNISVMSSLLKDLYRVKVATNGETALKIASSHDAPDIILLDIMMPGMDGYEVCRELKSSVLTKKIPVIFITSLLETEDETKGFDIGAVDYITKPVSPPVVLARVKTHLALYDQNRTLEEKVRERTQDLVHGRDVTIHSMAVLAETRDNETGDHIMRTKNYVRILAERLMVHPRFRDSLDLESVELLFKSTPLHDIGKVGVPDRILLKPGKLTVEEFEEMKMHTVYGRNAILKAEEALGDNPETSFLRIAREITISHHEKWDGSGYPYGLKGQGIPISGRLMAIADVYDALVSKRVYKNSMPHEEAVQIITEGDGRTMPNHFDPAVLEAFVELNMQFKIIAEKYQNEA